MQYLYKMPGTGLNAERHFAFYEVKLILKPRGKKYRMPNGNNWMLNGDFVKTKRRVKSVASFHSR